MRRAPVANAPPNNRPHTMKETSMVRSIIIRSVALSASLGLAGSALADDLTPPPWRGNPGTTVQHWDFSSGPTGFAPDALPLNNIYGTPVMIPVGGATWLP